MIYSFLVFKQNLDIYHYFHFILIVLFRLPGQQIILFDLFIFFLIIT